ncbi:MAG: hypothetical protein NTY30_04310 [Candidatus Berkelbacteria bacterium]|nr:hypothetical protein [Candidatus Berkelbacteria bacterium]
MSKRTRTIILIVIVGLLIIGTGVLVWLKYFHKTSADTFANIEHQRIARSYANLGQNYVFNNAIAVPVTVNGNGTALGGFSYHIQGTYQTLDPSTTASARKYNNQPIEYTFNITDVNTSCNRNTDNCTGFVPKESLTKVWLSADLTYFDNAGRDTETLPENFSAIIHLKDGTTQTFSLDKLIYQPIILTSYINPVKPEIKSSVIDKIDLLRASPDQSQKETIISVSLATPVNSGELNLLPVTVVKPSGVMSHYAFGSGLQYTGYSNYEDYVNQIGGVIDRRLSFTNHELDVGATTQSNNAMLYAYEQVFEDQTTINLKGGNTTTYTYPVQIYLRNGTRVDKNLETTTCTYPSPHGCGNPHIFLATQVNNIDRIDVFQYPIGNASAKELLVRVDRQTFTGEYIPVTISTVLTVSPSSGTSSQLYTIKATVSDTNTITSTTNYSFWWNCNTNSISVTDTIKACGQPRVKGDLNFTQQQRDTGFQAENYYATNSSGRRITANEFQGTKNFPAGARTIKVIVERNGQAVEKRIELTVNP